MKYKIKNEKGEVVNRIVADEKFVKEKHDGLFELIPEQEIVMLPEEPEVVTPTVEERLAELESKLSSIDSSLKTLAKVSVSK